MQFVPTRGRPLAIWVSWHETDVDYMRSCCSRKNRNVRSIHVNNITCSWSIRVVKHRHVTSNVVTVVRRRYYCREVEWSRVPRVGDDHGRVARLSTSFHPIFRGEGVKRTCRHVRVRLCHRRSCFSLRIFAVHAGWNDSNDNALTYSHENVRETTLLSLSRMWFFFFVVGSIKNVKFFFFVT